VDANHALIVKKIVEEINGPMKGTFEKQPTKKRPNMSRNVISKFFLLSKILQSYVKTSNVRLEVKNWDKSFGPNFTFVNFNLKSTWH
jgi:hypothetical protein